MHIAFLIPEYPHPKVNHSAGLGNSIKNLAEALVSKGVQVTLFIYGQSKAAVFQEKEITYHFIENKSYRLGKWFFYRKHIQNYCNKVIEADKIDVIEAADWTGVTAFMNFKVPLVIRFHGSDTYFCHLEKRKQKWKNRFYETLAVRNAQGYVAPTKFAGEVSAKLFGLSSAKIKTVHNGLNLKRFQNDSPLQFEKGLLLYIGTIIRKKGVFELPIIFEKVLKEMPEVKLVLIGGDSADIQTGSNSTWSLVQQQFSKEALLCVTYLGKIPYSDVQAYIKNSNVCLFPTYAETLGMVTIEAMAMQKPVVNSDFGWAQELMEDGKSGFLVHPSNHEEYANRIISVLQNDTLSVKIGMEALDFVKQNFDIQKIVQQNIIFYKNLI
ncbi:glycosyltransferase family 4 protein [Flavobacterium antarcticum]|uniref:glycosyltransferase family 4 protein n=1 Tax=Flavobacterium antarcticum TaxID=271155 RepID=UPI0003B43311|nr:glycosyltransferase family 4 protein [Flavobacterium antarcticum]